MSRLTLTSSTDASWFYPRLCIAHQSGTITVSSTATGYSSAALTSPLTYSAHKLNALTGTVDIDFGSAKTISYVALYITDIGTSATITPQYWDGAAWQTYGTALTLTKRGPVAWMNLTGTSTQKIRLSVSGTAAPEIAFFGAGAVTVFECGIPPGMAPASLNPDDEFSNTFSEGGQVLSSQLLRTQAAQSISMDGVTPSWVDTNWPTVRTLMNTNGMFFAFNPKDRPDEVIYGMRGRDKPTVNYSSSQYMALSFTIEGPQIEL